LPPDRYPQASAAGSLIERALEGEREAPAISIDASQHPAVVRALEELLSERRAFSGGLNDLLEILFAETSTQTGPEACDLSGSIVNEQSQIEETRAALRGDRERVEAGRQAAGAMTGSNSEPDPRRTRHRGVRDVLRPFANGSP
jgi:hypothetical protein